MPVTAQQLDAFHRFGAEQLQNGEFELSWDELFILWESRNSRGEVNSAIREGLADVDTGQFESSDKVLADLRDEFGIQE